MLRNALLFLALVEGAAFGQSADAPDVFEVASIKPAAPQGADGRYFAGCTGGPGSKDPGRITCTNQGLGGLIAMAYKVSVFRISGLKAPYPSFDIIAKVPAGATRSQITRMWQNLLAGRFHLAVHWETKDVPAYVLTVAKGGLKAKESAEQLDSDAGEPSIPRAPAKLDKEGFPVVAPGGSLVLYGDSAARFVASSCSMKELAVWLERRLAADTQANRPVVDATGLNGKYDLKMMFAFGNDAPGDVPSLPKALESQLGLRLEQKQARIEFLLVDHAEKSPVEN
jgi:uncharacterized protein (TIGR03435 family)